MPVSAEGRVEHQKQNQTATSQWPVGFVFGVQLDYSFRLKSVPSDAEKVVEDFLGLLDFRLLHIFAAEIEFFDRIFKETLLVFLHGEAPFVTIIIC